MNSKFLFLAILLILSFSYCASASLTVSETINYTKMNDTYVWQYAYFSNQVKWFSLIKTDISSIASGLEIANVDYCARRQNLTTGTPGDNVSYARIDKQLFYLDDTAFALAQLFTNNRTNDSTAVNKWAVNDTYDCINITAQFLEDYSQGHQNMSIAIWDTTATAYYTAQDYNQPTETALVIGYMSAGVQTYKQIFSVDFTSNLSWLPYLNVSYYTIKIKTNSTNISVPKYGDNITAQVNVSGLNSIAWCNFTVTTPANGKVIDNISGVNSTNTLWNSSSFLINGTGDGQWNISVNCSDIYSNTTVFNWSFNINDTAPILDVVSIVPSPASLTDNLTASCNSSDSENNTISYLYEWFINNIDTGISNINLTYGNFSSNDNITLQCIANDGYKNSTAKNSTILTIGDTTNPIIINWTLDALGGYTNEIHTISVDCTDNSGRLSYVRVEFINPNGENVGNKSMTISGGIYAYSYSFNIVGIYTNFTFHCGDQSGNIQHNTTALTFTSAQSGTTLPAGGGGGSENPTECGNNICEIGENAINCPLDCSINFTINPSDLNLVLARGDEFLRDFTISNPTSELMTVNVYFEKYQDDESYTWSHFIVGNTTSRDVILIIPQGNIARPGYKTFFVKTQVPKDAELKDYRFNIILQKGNRKILITYRIIVSDSPSIIVTGISLASGISKFMISPVVNLPIINFISIPIVIIIGVMLLYIALRLGK